MMLSPFAVKKYYGNPLYRRLHGYEYQLSQGDNTLDVIVEYPHVKMTGLEIIGSENLDHCDFTVHDSENGDYSGESFRKLNQFGFGVRIKEGSHVHVCKYDADLYLGMLVRIMYHSKSAKTIGINCYFDEVKAK